MRTETKTRELYTYDELSDEARETAISNHYDWNVWDGYWYESVFEDAEDIGIEIAHFDIGRTSEIGGKLIDDIDGSIAQVLANHGPTCNTNELAAEYRHKLRRLQCIVAVEYDTDDALAADDAIVDLEAEYLHDMLEEYLCILRRDYEYHTSDEAIAESLEANEMEFTIDGENA